jgi:hypothetical protein
MKNRIISIFRISRKPCKLDFLLCDLCKRAGNGLPDNLDFAGGGTPVIEAE